MNRDATSGLNTITRKTRNLFTFFLFIYLFFGLVYCNGNEIYMNISEKNNATCRKESVDVIVIFLVQLWCLEVLVAGLRFIFETF